MFAVEFPTHKKKIGVVGERERENRMCDLAGFLHPLLTYVKREREREPNNGRSYRLPSPVTNNSNMKREREREREREPNNVRSYRLPSPVTYNSNMKRERERERDRAECAM